MCVCKICGKEYDPSHYVDQTKKVMIEKCLCFSCWFWQEQYNNDQTNPENTVIVDGKHYRICPDDPNAYFQGFSGRKFTIKFNDGRIVETHNLWHQGTVPDGHFKRLMPDNAIFL